jgi:hypothetical protein
MADNVLYLHHLQYRRLEEQLIHLRNHATTLHGCEKAVYFIDKAIYDLKVTIAAQLSVDFGAADAEIDLSPPDD